MLTHTQSVQLTQYAVTNTRNSVSIPCGFYPGHGSVEKAASASGSSACTAHRLTQLKPGAQLQTAIALRFIVF